MKISLDLIKKLREKTGISIKECKTALEEATRLCSASAELRRSKEGILEKATEILRKKGEQVMALKATRETKSGMIEAYIHQDRKQAAIIKLLCETDFVAKNEEFKQLAHDLAMQVVALKPRWILPDQIPSEIIEKEKEIYLKKIDKNKPAAVKEKIIQGKIEKFYKETCLLKQPFIKDENLSIEELIASYVNKLGEKIEVGEFVKFEI